MRGVFLIYLFGMAMTIHLGDNVEADGTDLILDCLEQLVAEGYDMDDLVVSMLCCIAAIAEADGLEDTQLQ